MSAVLYCGNRNYSSWSIRGSLLVRQSGIECAEAVIPLDTEEGRAKIAAVSPTRRVPVLHIDGLVIWDTLAIAEFLHERAPDARIWPVEPTARAIARSVSAEMHSGFGALRSQMPMDIRGKHTVPSTPELQRDIERIEDIWRECRARNARGGDYPVRRVVRRRCDVRPGREPLSHLRREAVARRAAIRGRGLEVARVREPRGRGGRGAVVVELGV